MICDSFKFRGYQCFKKHWAGFDQILPINVIIGRNNTGKSQLLDLVESACRPINKTRNCDFFAAGSLDQKSLERVFPINQYRSDLSGDLWHDHGRHLVGVKFEIEYQGNQEGARKIRFLNAPNSLAQGIDGHLTHAIEIRRQILQEVTREKKTILSDRIFRPLKADRDIKSEAGDNNLGLYPDGSGATNIVRRYLTSAKFSRDLVHVDLLSALNEIFGLDGKFTEIEVKFHDEQTLSNQPINSWEIYLGQSEKGLVALSSSGSGLKTVLLVLLNLLIVPVIENHSKDSYVFAFEELENNLHPALLRRLLTYIEQYVAEHKATVFLTTHSSVMLDMFGISPNAQVIHVSHDGDSASARTVAAHFDRTGIIAELGARPSDLLQANGILWVEGPSDRIYLNRWIELMSDGKLKEGRDYSCACYGGSVLATAQFTSPEEADTELNNLLRINPNIAVICDSDRTSKTGDGAVLKDRVARIKTEVERIPGAKIWITEAKEIENYLPAEVLGAVFKEAKPPAPEKYDRFLPSKAKSSFVEQHLGLKSIDKVELASLATPHMSLDQMKARFDWTPNVTSIVEAIKRWNA